MVRGCGLILLLVLLSCTTCPKEPSKVIQVFWSYNGDAVYELIADGEKVGILNNKSDLICIEGKDSCTVIVKLIDNNGNISKGKLAVWRKGGK